MSGFSINTELGNISMRWRPDAAPITVDYIKKLIESGAYNGTTFYRSDFVIQCGLYPKPCPVANLSKNETHSGTKLSNDRGTAAIAHFDVPDNGNCEFFINLKSNSHLDSAYGGYCVFAEVAGDYAAVDAIADAIANKGKKTIKVNTMTLI